MARNGTLRNVVVCLDLNANDVCDSGEPASAPTGANGQYTLSYDPAAVPNAASARLIAPVKTGDPAAATTTIDSYNPAVAATNADYVLTRPAGSGGAINPLTTLVQTGVAAGMPVADARANVAQQLAIAPAKIDGYQDDPAWDDAQVRDTARTAAALISTMLRTGAPLQVGNQTAAVAADTLLNLNNLYFQDGSNFFVQTLETQAKAAGTPGGVVLDARAGKTGGADRPIGNDANALYRSAYLSPDGWKWCGPTVPIAITVGNPNRAVVCGSRVQLSWSRGLDIAGQGMAGFISASGSSANVVNPAGALGSATFPAGSQERVGSTVVLASDITIDNFFTRSQPASRRTLQSVVDYYPTAGASTPTGANTLSMGVSTSALRNLRVSFTSASSATQGTVQYYECDLNEAQTEVSNCAAGSTGTYRIDTVNGAPVMRFAGHPDTPAVNYNVTYTQIQWTAGDPESQWVYRAHEVKPDFNSRLSTTDRLNATAWSAMKTALGL